MKAKRLLAVLMCCLTVCTMVACGKSEDDDPIDPTKTQLYVSNYDGGFGDEWLRKAADRFEELHKGDKLEEGKTGIQIRIVNHKKQGDQILTEMITTTNEIFFCESLPYRDGALQNYFLDITEAVTEPLTEYGEQGSIEDKMTTQQQKWFKVNGSYYAIPHYEGYYGMSYDVDTFDERNLFMTDSGTFTNYSGRGKGVDGVAGTYDDGLPANTTQFFKLLDEMKRQGLSPIGWPGYYPRYMSDMLVNYSAAYEGYAQTMLNYTFNGAAENLITLNGSTVVADEKDLGINDSNGYELQRQAGKYYALKFAERIIDGDYWFSGSFNNSQTHKDSQDAFLIGAFDKTQKEIGILIDGTWWENEASETFAAMAKRYPGSGKGERRFGIMPFPMPDGEESRSQTAAVVDHLASTAFINKNIADYKKEVAIDFIRFTATDASLVEFTQMTSTPKALQYELTGTQLSELTYLGQQVWNFKKDSQVVYKFSDTPLYYLNMSHFTNNNWESGTQTIPSQALDEGMSAEEYFKGMYNTSKTGWANLIK